MISIKKFQAVADLDFSAIKLKLMHPTFGEGWSQTKADAMETEYRRFLYLQMTFPDEQTAPTLDVDTFWHYHILDTMQYSADCEKVFGHFLHHYPYLGLMEGDEPDLEIEVGNKTRELYEATFGEAYIRAEAYGDTEPDGADTRKSSAIGTDGRAKLCVNATYQDDGNAAKPAVKGGASAKCQGVCIVAKPAAKGSANAKCQGVCIVAKPAAKGVVSAKCQGVCITAKPAGKGTASAKCQGVCIVAKPVANGVASARRQGICSTAKPAAKGIASAKCQGVCIVAKPAVKEAATTKSMRTYIGAKAAAKGGASAKCQGVCIVSKPKEQGNPTGLRQCVPPGARPKSTPRAAVF